MILIDTLYCKSERSVLVPKNGTASVNKIQFYLLSLIGSLK